MASSKIANDTRRNTGSFQKLITNELVSNLTSFNTINSTTGNITTLNSTTLNSTILNSAIGNITTINTDDINLSTLSGDIVGTTDIQTLTNKTINDNTNDVASNRIKTTTGSVLISGTSPTTGQILIASDSTNASWAVIPFAQFLGTSAITGIVGGGGTLSLDTTLVSVGGLFSLSGGGVLVSQACNVEINYSVVAGNDPASAGNGFIFNLHVDGVISNPSGMFNNYQSDAEIKTISRTSYLSVSAGALITVRYVFFVNAGTGRISSSASVPGVSLFIKRL